MLGPLTEDESLDGVLRPAPDLLHGIVVVRVILGQIVRDRRNLHTATGDALQIFEFIPEAEHHLSGDVAFVALDVLAYPARTHHLLGAVPGVACP
jgi:hypothetical protein